MREIYRTLLLAAACGITAALGAQTQTSSEGTSQAPPGPQKTEALERIFAGDVPKSVAELKAMEAYNQALLKKIVPCTVNVGGGGSGVLIKGGYVLCAGHVTLQAGKTMPVVLNSGRRIQAKTLGADHRVDSGLLKITTEGDFPGLEMGKSSDMKPGAWCMLLGHPGGRKAGLIPPARFGRILQVPETGYLVTDCTISAGDSGGPLFDMDGRVIGINSRIGQNLASNMHVPVDAFHKEWKKLVAGEVTGSFRGNRGRRGRGSPRPARSFLGVRTEQTSKPPRVLEVTKDSPADKAGLKVGDVILKFDGRDLPNGYRFSRYLGRKEPGQKAKLQVKRGDKQLDLEVTLAKPKQR